MKIRPDLSVCIHSKVKNPKILDLFLSSLLTIDDHLSLEIVILGRNKAEKTFLDAVKQFKQVRVVDLGEKYSLAEAMSQAMQVSDGRYISMWNLDIVVTQDCLMRLVEFLDANPTVGIAAPSLYDGDKIQAVAHALPSLRELFGRTDNTGSFASGNRMNDHIKVDWLTGPGLVINRYMVEEIGVVSRRYPFYWSLEYCLRAAKYGWHIYYCPQARAMGSIENWSEQGHNRLTLLQEQIALILLILLHRFRK